MTGGGLDHRGETRGTGLSATPTVDRGAPDWSAIAVVSLGASACAAAQGLTYPPVVTGLVLLGFTLASPTHRRRAG